MIAAQTGGASALAAVYERELDASLDRIWENVLDWEHLPYLHSQAFTSVRMDRSDAESWHGLVGLPGGGEAEIDVTLDRPGLRYTTRTVAGVGAGTDIVTFLEPRDTHRTAIRVEFHLPWAPEAARASIGEAYRAIYVELWDQDEAMMRERQHVLDSVAARSEAGATETSTSPGRVRELSSVSLGRVRELASRLPLDVELGGRRFRVVSVDGQLVAFDTRCPHLGGPLQADGCEAACPWHGYRFDLRSGHSSDGRTLRLGRAPGIEINPCEVACEGEVRLRLS